MTPPSSIGPSSPMDEGSVTFSSVNEKDMNHMLLPSQISPQLTTMGSYDRTVFIPPVELCGCCIDHNNAVIHQMWKNIYLCFPIGLRATQLGENKATYLMPKDPQRVLKKTKKKNIVCYIILFLA